MAARILPDPITAESLRGLIEAGVSEGQTIDFKTKINAADSPSKLKLCAEVASFANASGGDIIFGAEESAGCITAFVGLQHFDPDETELQLRQIFLSNIDPAVPGLKFVTVEVESGKTVLILRVPRSWNRPHAVADISCFPVRDGNQRRSLRVSELREAFGLSVELSERMRRFRADRIGALVGGETQVELASRHLIVTHLMPQSAFDSAEQIDLSRARKLRPKLLGADGSGPRMNFDGVMHTHPSLGLGPENKVRSYVQLFRNGCVEAACVIPLVHNSEALLHFGYERTVASATRAHLGMMRDLGIEPPIFFGLAIVGAENFRLSSYGQFNEPVSTEPIGKIALVIPETAIEEFPCDLEAELKSIFDWVWHAVGANGSPNYDQTGRWRPPAGE